MNKASRCCVLVLVLVSVLQMTQQSFAKNTAVGCSRVNRARCFWRSGQASGAFNFDSNRSHLNNSLQTSRPPRSVSVNGSSVQTVSQPLQRPQTPDKDQGKNSRPYVPHVTVAKDRNIANRSQSSNSSTPAQPQYSKKQSTNEKTTPGRLRIERPAQQSSASTISTSPDLKKRVEPAVGKNPTVSSSTWTVPAPTQSTSQNIQIDLHLP